MDDELNKINADVAKHIGFALVPDQSLFDLGVRLGRHLQANGIDAYQLPVFEEIKITINEIEIKNSLIRTIGERLLVIVKSANKEQLLRSKFIEYSARHDKTTKRMLDAQTADKFCISHISTSQDEEGSDFELTIEATGQLAEIFNAHQMSPIFYVSLSNYSGGDNEVLQSESDISKFYGSHFTKDNPPLKNVQNFIEDFDKFFVMFALKMN
jgi:hypothetical protein